MICTKRSGIIVAMIERPGTSRFAINTVTKVENVCFFSKRINDNFINGRVVVTPDMVFCV